MNYAVSIGIVVISRDSSGLVTEIDELSYDMYLKKVIQYYASGAKRMEAVFDGNAERKVVSSTSWDENGNIIE